MRRLKRKKHKTEVPLSSILSLLSKNRRKVGEARERRSLQSTSSWRRERKAPKRASLPLPSLLLLLSIPVAQTSIFHHLFLPLLSLCGWVGVPTELSHPEEEEEEARPTSIPPSIHPFVVHNNTVMLPERKRGGGGLLTFALMKEGANKTITHEKQC